MKVIVGMSGGVDSSVAAYLLLQKGYEVEGLFMRNWDSTLNGDYLGNPDLLGHDICPQEEDYEDAIKVCEKLGIKLHRVDFVREYWDNVFTYFLEELKKGRTPNPDILCNKYIKFDVFVKEAKKLGADKFATGHYAKYEKPYLKLAVDDNKDQTYFLSGVSGEQLEDVIFPLADLSKERVREIAEKLGLITAKKKDSTGICFIGERNFSKFLENYLPNKPGKIIDIESEKYLGDHSGLMHYTIGQRKGLHTSSSDRLFVVGKDLNRNVLYVAKGDDNPYLYSDSTLLENVNFNVELRPKKVLVRFRHRAKMIPATIEYLDNNYVKIIYGKAKAVTPGQQTAIYYNDICIGGGEVLDVYKNNNKLWYIL